jgi:hypothetical protein
MSLETLTSLRDYLYGTLSTENMLWLASQLESYAKSAKKDIYTKEDIYNIIKEGERQISEGKCKTTEEVFSSYKELKL